MIVTEKQAKYHLSYLKSLKTLRSGHFDNELLSDGIHRVLLARIGKADGMDYDNQVTIEVDGGGGRWQEVSQYQADTGPMYCVPSNTGPSSTDRAVASRITKLLNSMQGIDDHVCDGILPQKIRNLSYDIRCKLIAQGWRITATDNSWKVLPPRPGVRNDNAHKGGAT